jgi:hypothetical protein
MSPIKLVDWATQDNDWSGAGCWDASGVARACSGNAVALWWHSRPLSCDALADLPSPWKHVGSVPFSPARHNNWTHLRLIHWRESVTKR